MIVAFVEDIVLPLPGNILNPGVFASYNSLILATTALNSGLTPNESITACSCLNKSNNNVSTNAFASGLPSNLEKLYNLFHLSLSDDVLPNDLANEK